MQGDAPEAGARGAQRLHAVNLEYKSFFVTSAFTFGSVYNMWAFFALLSVLATQLNNLNLTNIFFPELTDETQLKRRRVTTGLTLLTCGLVGDKPDDEPLAETSWPTTGLAQRGPDGSWPTHA